MSRRRTAAAASAKRALESAADSAAAAAESASEAASAAASSSDLVAPPAKRSKRATAVASAASRSLSPAVAAKPRGKKKTAAAAKSSAAASDSAADAAMEDDAASEAASEAAAAKPLSKAQKAAAAKAKAAATKAAKAAAAAATAYSGPAFANRCDVNSLSLVLSHLSSADFRSAVRVSSQWLRAACVNTAWPAFSVRDLIDRLALENYDDPAQRRLRVTYADAHRLTGSALFRRINDLRLEHVSTRSTEVDVGRDAIDQASEEAALALLPSLPFLSAVNLHLKHASANPAPLTAFLSAMGERLQVLILSVEDRWFARQLALWSILESISVANLTRLRVLVLHAAPPKDLDTLHALEFLHLDVYIGELTLPLARSVRLLSGRHALRAVSLQYNFKTSRYIYPQPEFDSPETFVRTLTCDRADIRPFRRTNQAGHIGWGVQPPTYTPEELRTLQETFCEEIARLDDFSLIGVSSHLRDLVPLRASRLHVQFANSDVQPTEAFPATLAVGLARITRLTLDESDWRAPSPMLLLRFCHLLRALKIRNCDMELDLRHQRAMDLSHLILHDGRVSLLEELTIDGYSIADFTPLLRCPALAKLDLTSQPTADLDALAPVLAQLTRFHTLELTVFKKEVGQFSSPPHSPFVLPASLMESVCRSSSWRSLCLHLSDASPFPGGARAQWSNDWSTTPDSDRNLAAGAMVDAATAERFRLSRHSADGDVEEFRVGIKRNKQAWVRVVV